MSDFQFDAKSLERLSRLVTKANNLLDCLRGRDNIHVEGADSIDLLECALLFWGIESGRRTDKAVMSAQRLGTLLENKVSSRRRKCEDG